MAIKPGNFSSNQTNYTAFYNSMAEEIETQLNDLLTLDGLPPLLADESNREVRDRRRLFVAIARAVVKHLDDRKDFIDIPVPDGIGGTDIVHPTFQIEGL